MYLGEHYQDPDIDTDKLIELTEVPLEYIHEFGEPDVVGLNYEIDIEKLLSDPNHYEEVIQRLWKLHFL